MRIMDMKVGIKVNPALELRHATAKGTGAALRARLIVGGALEGRGLLIGLAPQATVNGRESQFDFDNTQCAFFGLVGVAQMLQVLRGEVESIAEGKGVWQSYEDGHAVVKFDHRVEPAHGYVLQIITKPSNGEEAEERFWFSPAEALGLCEALAVALKQIAFGM